MTFVDTNYFLRFLLNDVSAQHEQAKALFRKGASGEVKLCTSLIVIFEIFWVMVATYQKTKPEVIEILRDVLSMSFIHLEERQTVLDALDIYRDTTLEFEDCYNTAYAKSNHITDFASFDKKLVKFVTHLKKLVKTS